MPAHDHVLGLNAAVGHATAVKVGNDVEYLDAHGGSLHHRWRGDGAQVVDTTVGGGQPEPLVVASGGHQLDHAVMVQAGKRVGLVTQQVAVVSPGDLDHHSPAVHQTHRGVEAGGGVHTVNVPTCGDTTLRWPLRAAALGHGVSAGWRYRGGVVVPVPQTSPSGATPWTDDGAGAPVPRWGLGDVAIGIFLFFAVQVVAGVLVTLVFIATNSGLSLEDAASGDNNLWLLGLSAPLSWAVLVGWPWWVSRTKGSGSMARDFGLAMRWTDPLLGVAGGVMALACSAALALTYSAVFGGDAPTNADIVASESRSVSVFILLFVIVAVGTPIAEEVFFRGLVLGAARKSWGVVAGVLFSSLMFGAIHIQAGLASWAFVGLVTGIYGVVFALLRVWSQGRIAGAIVAHMTVNGVAVAVIFFT